MSRRKFTADKRDEATTEIPRPPGYTPETGALIALQLDNESLASFGIRASDTPIALRTSDVRAGDLALAEMPDGTMLCGLYRTARGGRFTIANDIDAEAFTEGQPAGRVVAVLRDGKYIQPKVTLRPIPAGRRSKKRERHTPNVYENIRALETVRETDGNRESLQSLCDAVALWARYLMEINPTSAARFYRACVDAWEDSRAEVYGRGNPNDARERQTAAFNGAFIERYRAVFSIADPCPATTTAQAEREAKERAALLFRMQSQLAQMAGRADASVAVPDADEHARHVEYVKRLVVLRARLANLGDDITDSTERFKIEREIYDLEREQERDEWPEIIGEGGAW